LATEIVRIGVEIGPYDPYWVEVKEIVCRQLESQHIHPVHLDIAESNQTFYQMDASGLIEEILALELDALICINMPPEIILRLCDSGLPIVSISEGGPIHPLHCQLTGLYTAGQMAGNFVAARLGGRGRVLGVGGFLDWGEDKGISRINGFKNALNGYPAIEIQWIPTFWDYESALEQVKAGLVGIDWPIHAIFGLSDSLIIAARDALITAGRLDSQAVLVGINGDPQTLTAILEGHLTATIETSAQDQGSQAATLALQAARRQPLPAYFSTKPRLITLPEVADVALLKLVAISGIPRQLVGVNRAQQQKRLRQLETSSAINRKVGALLDRKQLTREVAGLIRTGYGYDLVQVFLWSKTDQVLTLEGCEPASEPLSLSLHAAGLLGEAVKSGEAIFIPDTYHSLRFPVDSHYPQTRSRVVLPVRLGEEVIALLDLHSNAPNHDLRQDLVGLQPLADQLAIALRNADLYSEAVIARDQAEKADQLKTRLLANVSHELRAPLNVIMGYSKSALQEPNPYHEKIPRELQRDLQYIYQGGEHLIRIINDLLDVSRAEIGELCLFPEPIELKPFLIEVFKVFTRGIPANPQLEWKLDLAIGLPVILADPARLRQVLYNLVSNAAKFTPTGQITLGGDVEPPHVHIWVADTGPGIPVDQQERIFEPFVSISHSARRSEGIGLGLSITRYLVALHHGSITLESQPGRGSVFHVYLPLPGLVEQIGSSGPASLESSPKSSSGIDGKGGPGKALFVITAQECPPAEIRRIANRQGLGLVLIHSIFDLDQAAAAQRPVSIAWDLSSTTPAEWQLLQYLQTVPAYNQLPFILFRENEQPGQGWNSFTNVFTKPFNRQSLLDFLKCLPEADAVGTVLIADDDPQAREYYARLVAEALPGYRVLEAENGERVLQVLVNETPDLILLDLMMPEVDGFAVLESLRSKPRTAQIPVVVISGKKLTLTEVQRLDYARVSFHSKGLLSPEETVGLIRKTFNEQDDLCQPTSQLVRYILVYIQQHYSEALSRKVLANTVGVSEEYLSRIFRQELGISLWDALTRLRIQVAKELLQAGDASINRVASGVGFNDSAYFSRVFHKLTGVSPLEYRKQKE